MDIQGTKLELVKMILETDNPSLLESARQIFAKEKHLDFYDSLSQDQKEDILEGFKEVESGATIDYQKFIKKIKNGSSSQNPQKLKREVRK